jgi:hypothetical protein
LQGSDRLAHPWIAGRESARHEIAARSFDLGESTPISSWQAGSHIDVSTVVARKPTPSHTHWKARGRGLPGHGLAFTRPPPPGAQTVHAR